jgi:VIT1/CCC1 family predicted Fe2+/Mn2+ transporter
VIKRAGVYPEDHVNLALGDFDPFNKSPDDITPRFVIGAVNALLHFRGELLEVSNNETEVAMKLILVGPRLSFGLQIGDSRSHSSHSGLELLSGDQSTSKTVDQSS